MGVQLRQNTKDLPTKGVIAAMAQAKQPLTSRGRKATMPDAVDTTATLQDLAELYAKIAERLLDQMHEHPNNRHQAQILGRHLDWVGSRAQMVGSFLRAGDCAMTYICASQEAYSRLLHLIKLAAQQLSRPGRLSVALYLAERIDEELHLV